jgi:LysM repeat protein
MKEFRQVLLGILAALVSVTLLVGSLSLTLMEGGLRQAFAPSVTFTSTIISFQTLTASPFISMTAGPSPIISLTLTPSYTPSPMSFENSACSHPPGWEPYAVWPGDTLDVLAAKYNTSVENLIAGNCLMSTMLLLPMILYVPGPPPTPTPTPCLPPPGWGYYTVQPGDTLYHIAMLFSTTYPNLQAANCMDSTVIWVGQQLYVPNVPTITADVTFTPVPPPPGTPTPTPPLPPDTPTPTEYIPPTDTPTNPPPPTDTPTPTSTDTPMPTATQTPTPTDTPVPTPTVTAGPGH